MSQTVGPPRRRAGHRVYVPDEVLLRRFGIVRAVGGGAYIIAVIIIGAIYGTDAWPLLLGIPVLAVVTTLYFQRSMQAPRIAVAASLVADTIVLGGAAAFVGGTGSGTGALYVIPIVSAGIILGPAAASAFTTLSVVLAWLQLLSEEMLYQPVVLHRSDMGDRVVVLMITSAVLISVGYLTATYASSLQDNIAEAGDAADEVARRTRRRRSFVHRATVDIRRPLAAVEAVADQLDGPEPLDTGTRYALAAQLRMRAVELDGEIGQLADVGALDEARENRPEPVQLSRVVADCIHDLGPRLAHHEVNVEVPPIRVVGDRRGARRILYNLLENVAEHTPAGTTVWVEARTTGGQGVLVVTDDGPGIAPDVAARLFDPPGEDGPDGEGPDGIRPAAPRVGMPLVQELVDAMGAEITYERRAAGGSIFLVGFRLAPRDAPGPDEDDAARTADAASHMPPHQTHQ